MRCLQPFKHDEIPLSIAEFSSRFGWEFSASEFEVEFDLKKAVWDVFGWSGEEQGKAVKIALEKCHKKNQSIFVANLQILKVFRPEKFQTYQSVPLVNANAFNFHRF